MNKSTYTCISKTKCTVSKHVRISLQKVYAKVLINLRLSNLEWTFQSKLFVQCVLFLFLGLSDRERIIYSTGITIFVILFAFLTVALIYLYKRRSNSTKTFVVQLEPTNIAGESEDHQSIGKNVYNVIDESEIYDDNILPNLCCRDNHSEFVPDTSEDECSSGYLKPIACTNLNREPHPCISSVYLDSGYLHPYHSILPHLREKPAIYSTCETDSYLEVLPDVESESTEDATLQNIL